ncbi:hypothetical protein [uncultured Polaribacter sp.]|uniref:hypothetical protein n=1 Tax=uncultured Polaribacter sp. TaxID=174711 RepID=UPI0026045243|nr:hypothetical protein [uncultured Polaribacter sp.]
MDKKILLIAVFVFGFNTNNFCQNGKLYKGKESLKTTNSSSSNKGTTKISRSRRHYNNEEIRSPFASIIWGIFAYTVYGVAVESPWEKDSKMHDAEIAHYPFEKTTHGNFIYTDSINYNLARFDITNSFVIENSNLYGNNLGVNFRFLRRFAIDVDYLYLKENVNSINDSFYLYAALLKYYRIRTQKFDAWFGLGAMHVANDVHKTGFGLGFGAEWFIAKPISLEFTHKWTNINSQEVHKTKVYLKYYLKNYHISSGYEHFKIGVSKINAFSIGVGASF